MRLLICIVPVALMLMPTEMKPVEAVADMDLERYAGRWYEIARLPNRFQKSCSCCATATYELRDDGRVDVINRCQTADGSTEARGLARRREDDAPASELKVRFAPGFLSWLPSVWADYWVIALDPQYRFAMVGQPERKYLWILSRTPQLPEETYETLLARAAAMGYDIATVERTPQEEGGHPNQ